MTRAYDLLAPLLGISNAVALLLLIVFLLLGPTRKFWVVLLYVSWELFATAGLTLADMLLNGTSQQMDRATQTAASRLYARFYWSNDVVVDLLRLVLVMVLIYRIAESAKPTIGRILSGVVVAMAVLPFVLFHPTFERLPQQLIDSAGQFGSFAAEVMKLKIPRVAWFNSTSQLLNFGAAIMNVILWGALIKSRNREPHIVPLSLGLGILVTGTALSYGLRHFALFQGGFTAAFNLFLNLTQLGAWLIWCRAFWPKRKAPEGRLPSA
ncbi:MAG: hypothetical protein ABSF22_23550 [Bryobacteraceae bacterium]